jgi:hypothetical protein
MEKMILIPYEKYQRLTSKSTSQQNAMDDVTEGGGFKTPIEKKCKLGPPGAPLKPYDRHPKTNIIVFMSFGLFLLPKTFKLFDFI